MKARLDAVYKRLKEMVTHFFDQSFWQRAISILLAVFVWAIVISQDKSIRSKSINDIPIMVVGAEELAESGLALKQDIEELVSRNISIRVQGEKAQVSSLTNDNVRAYVDLNSILTQGENQVLEIKIEGVDNMRVTRITPYDSVTVTAEQLHTREIPVKAEFIGSLPEGYIRPSGEYTPSPGQITITGTESDVRLIEYAYIEIDLSDMTSSINKSFGFTLTDGDFNPVGAPTVKTSASAVIIRTNIYATKSVPVKWSANVIGEPASGYVCDEITAFPEEVIIAGAMADIAGIDAIFTSAINIDGRYEAFTQPVVFTVPTGVRWMSYDNAVAMINIKEIEKEDVVTGVQLTYINAPEGAVVTLADEKVNALVKGPVSAVNSLLRSDISAYVNLINYGAGEFEVPVIIELAGENQPLITFYQTVVRVKIEYPPV